MARRVVVAVVLLLSAIGVFGTVVRGADTIEVLVRGEPASGLSRYDAMNFAQSVQAYGLRPGTKSYTRIRIMHLEMSRKFWSQPVMTLLHMLGGLVIMALGPLQLWARFRASHPRIHRWCGRAVLAAAACVAISAFWFGFVGPMGGTGEVSAIALFGAFFTFAAVRAYLAIRRGDVATHRAWMTRMFAVALGTSTIRLVALAALLIFQGGADMVNPRSIGAMFWVGWLLTLAACELWLLREHRPIRRDVVRERAAPAEGGDEDRVQV